MDNVTSLHPARPPVKVNDDVITEPGVYDAIEAEEYHADPVPAGSLSRSGAMKLLPPSAPAVFDWERRHPQPAKKVFEIGHAAHRLVLGTGPELVLVDADEWRTKAVKEEVAEVRARGAVPLKPKEYGQVHLMAAAISEHPMARRLLQERDGIPEASLFWRDKPTGVWRRARPDHLPDHDGNGRLILADYKTAVSAHEDDFARSAPGYGYDMQDAWYSDAVLELGLADDVAFVFVVQEKSPPYLVNVVELDGPARKIGRRRNREAIDIYAECTRSGVWPGYGDEVAYVSMPRWFEMKYEDAL